MNRHDIIDRIGTKYHVGNTENGEFSYVQALKSVGKDIKDYQKATIGTKHQFLDIRFTNDRLVILVECKNRFSRWDKAKIQGQLQDYVRFEKAYSDKKIVAILAETEGDDVWVWYGQSVIIDDEHKVSTETVIRMFEEYENLCFGKVNDKIKIVDSIKQLNEKLHSDGINEKLRSQFVGTCLLALKNGLVYKDIKATIDPTTGKELSPEKVVLKNIKDILEGLLTKSGTVNINKASKLTILNNKVLGDQDVESLTYEELKEILEYIDTNVVPYINDKSTAGQDLLNLFFTTFNKYVKIIAIKRRRRVYFRDTITKIFTQNALKTIHNGVFRNFDDPSFILENEYDEACKKDYINAILENDTQKVLLSKYEKDRALQELFGDFDNIIYTVEMDGDLIESMSPGKKALVLLKLLISHDESKCPILLDQPEDDLDNLSIVSDLVAFIKERKRDRQIVLVTHNANLVLGCDAEEVIVANQQIDNNSLTHNKSFRFEYRSGSIENITATDSDTFLGSRGIQQHICNILEGGKEAFIARKNKYTNL